MSLPVRLALSVLRGYKRWLSPLLPGACRFSPTCSEYGRIAIRSHGLTVGAWYMLGRLLRCQPLGRGGIDLPPARPGVRLKAARTAAPAEL